MWQTITDFLSAIMTAFYSYQKDAMIDRPFVKLDFCFVITCRANYYLSHLFYWAKNLPHHSKSNPICGNIKVRQIAHHQLVSPKNGCFIIKHPFCRQSHSLAGYIFQFILLSSSVCLASTAFKSTAPSSSNESIKAR